jgi:hypothetical protein
MAYSTGTSTGPDDLLDKLRLFLIGTGWSVNKWDDDNTTYVAWSGLIGTGKRLHVQRTATDGTVMYFNLRSVNRGVIFGNYYNSTLKVSGKYYSEITGIGINGSTGYGGALAWDLQTGGPTNGSGASVGACITEISVSTIPAYYFFETGDTVVVVVEYETNKFQFITFGCLEKSGTYTGGQFYFASQCSYYATYRMLADLDYSERLVFLANLSLSQYGAGAVYHNADSVAGWRFLGAAGNSTSGYAGFIQGPAIGPYQSPTGAYSICLGAYAYTRSPNELNALAVLGQALLMTKRADGKFSFIGYPTGIRLCNVEFYAPAEELTIGSDIWKVFPAHTKEAECTNPHFGFAFHKTTGPSSSPSSTASHSPSSSRSASVSSSPSTSVSGSASNTPSVSVSSSPSTSPSGSISTSPSASISASPSSTPSASISSSPSVSISGSPSNTPSVSVSSSPSVSVSSSVSMSPSASISTSPSSSPSA